MLAGVNLQNQVFQKKTSKALRKKLGLISCSVLILILTVGCGNSANAKSIEETTIACDIVDNIEANLEINFQTLILADQKITQPFSRLGSLLYEAVEKNPNNKELDSIKQNFRQLTQDALIVQNKIRQNTLTNSDNNVSNMYEEFQKISLWCKSN